MRIKPPGGCESTIVFDLQNVSMLQFGEASLKVWLFAPVPSNSVVRGKRYQHAQMQAHCLCGYTFPTQFVEFPNDLRLFSDALVTERTQPSSACIRRLHHVYAIGKNVSAPFRVGANSLSLLETTLCIVKRVTNVNYCNILPNLLTTHL